MKCVTFFRGIATGQLGKGDSILFWKDLWNGHLFHNKYPRLFPFAKKQDCSIADFLSDDDPHSQFHLPLSNEAFEEYTQLRRDLDSITIQQETNGAWSYI